MFGPQAPFLNRTWPPGRSPGRTQLSGLPSDHYCGSVFKQRVFIKAVFINLYLFLSDFFKSHQSVISISVIISIDSQELRGMGTSITTKMKKSKIVAITGQLRSRKLAVG